MGHSISIHYTSVSVMFGAGLLMLWLLLAGHSLRDLSAKAILNLSGYLRTPPDPWLESRLRHAFAEFDRELATILHDRHPVRPPSPAQPGRPGHPGAPPDPADELPVTPS